MSTNVPQPPVPTTAPGRCLAAHPEDPRPCEGLVDAVQIVDQTGAAVAACLLHGSVLLASLDRGRVYALNGRESSAIAVYRRAQTLPPFDFVGRRLADPGAASRLAEIAGGVA